MVPQITTLNFRTLGHQGVPYSVSSTEPCFMLLKTLSHLMKEIYQGDGARGGTGAESLYSVDFLREKCKDPSKRNGNGQNYQWLLMALLCSKVNIAWLSGAWTQVTQGNRGPWFFSLPMIAFWIAQAPTPSISLIWKMGLLHLLWEPKWSDVHSG